MLEKLSVKQGKLLYAPVFVKENYDFEGWFDEDGNKVTSISEGTTGDISLTAEWAIENYSLIAVSEDSSKGTVTGGGTYTYNSSVTVNGGTFNGISFDDKRITLTAIAYFEDEDGVKTVFDSAEEIYNFF